MSEKSTYSFYLKDANAEWLEQRPENKSEYLDRLLDAARKQDLNGATAQEHVQLEKLRIEVESARSEYEAKQSLLDEVQEYKSQRDTLTRTYEDELSEILDQVEEDETHIWPEHDGISTLAMQESKEPQTVIEDAKELAAEQDRDIFTTQFVRAADAQYVDKKPITEANNE